MQTSSRKGGEIIGVCDNLVQIARNSLIPKMERCPSGCPPPRRSGYGQTSRRSSRLTQTRAKADEGARLESDFGDAYRATLKHLSRSQFSDLPLQDVPRCDPVNVSIRRQFRATLHSFYTMRVFSWRVRDHATTLRLATSRKNDALIFGVRFCVLKSTYTVP